MVYESDMLVVTKPVVDTAEVMLNKLSIKETSTFFEKGKLTRIVPNKIYERNPSTSNFEELNFFSKI